MGKCIIQYFRCGIYHMCVFNMACAGVCDCDCMPFPCRSDVSNIKLKIKNNQRKT